MAIVGNYFNGFKIIDALSDYKFYDSQYSYSRINPYFITDADDAFPSGDAFSVYPGADGKPEGSIRLMVFSKTLDDLRAFNLLEKLARRDFLIELIEGEFGEPITFDRYPKSDFYIMSLRNKVNKEIAERLKSTLFPA